jgi:hypothetical protein
VWEDSDEAKAWLAQRERQAGGAKDDSRGTRPSSPKEVTSSESPRPPPPPPASTGTPAPAPEKRKPPAKRKSSLASLAASAQKPKKINTLEKSKLDWQKWV